MSARKIKRRLARNMTDRLSWVVWLFGRADGVMLYVVPLSAYCIVQGVTA